MGALFGGRIGRAGQGVGLANGLSSSVQIGALSSSHKMPADMERSARPPRAAPVRRDSPARGMGVFAYLPPAADCLFLRGPMVLADLPSRRPWPPHAIQGFWQTSHQSNISFMQTIIKILPENLSDRIFYCLFFEMTAGFFARCFIDMNWYGQAWLHRHTALRGMPVSTTRGRCARCMPALTPPLRIWTGGTFCPFLRGNLAAASARRAQYPRASSSRTTS